MDERLTVTVPEAGRLLGISRALAYRLVRSGELPARRLGTRLVVPKEAINRFLESEVAAGQTSHEPSGTKQSSGAPGDIR